MKTGKQAEEEVIPWGRNFLVQQRKVWVEKGGELLAFSAADQKELMAKMAPIGDDIVKGKPELKPLWDTLNAALADGGPGLLPASALYALAAIRLGHTYINFTPSVGASLPALEELEGFCSASLLVDRASGRGVAAATFDNAGAIEENKDQLDRIKATGSQEANAEVLDQCDLELAVAHLRVPELV